MARCLKVKIINLGCKPVTQPSRRAAGSKPQPNRAANTNQTRPTMMMALNQPIQASWITSELSSKGGMEIRRGQRAPRASHCPHPSMDPAKPMLKLGLDVYLEFTMAVVQKDHAIL